MHVDLQTVRALPPGIWALGLAAMFMDMSSELVCHPDPSVGLR
jgi:hypothetical protein